MQNVPNIVRERLRGAETTEKTAVSAHPEADLLTAFAEKSLAERERRVVLEHLAMCGDCREVVALALPEMKETVVTAVPVRGWSWPALRWGLAVAGVALVASFGIMQYRRSSAERNVARLAVSQNERVAPAAAPGSVEFSRPPATVPATSPAGTATAAEKKEKHAELSSKVPPKADKSLVAGSLAVQAPISGGQLNGLQALSNTTPEAKRMNRAMASGAVAGSMPAAVEGRAAGGREGGATFGAPMTATAQQQAQQQDPAQVQTAQAQAAPAPVFPAGNPQPANGAPRAGASSQTVTVEVSAESPLIQTETASAQPPPQLTDKQDATYLSKAKPAMTPPLPGAAGSGLWVPSWSISSSGSLQRSFDQGKTWQNVDIAASAATTMSYAEAGNSTAEVAKVSGRKKQAAPTLHAVSAMGAEVWAGGSAGALYHSVDAGGHWIRVMPTSSGAVLSADIVSIEFSDAQHGKITTSSSSVWTTSDDGRSWDKK